MKKKQFRSSHHCHHFTQKCSVYIGVLNILMKEVCVQPRPSAVNVTLPAFTAERRAAAPLLLSIGMSHRCKKRSNKNFKNVKNVTKIKTFVNVTKNVTLS